jgi:hypothetical protein
MVAVVGVDCVFRVRGRFSVCGHESDVFFYKMSDLRHGCRIRWASRVKHHFEQTIWICICILS